MFAMSCMIFRILLLGYISDALHVNVMILYTSIGNRANITSIRQLAPIWEAHVNNNSIHDPTWPFNISVETFETASDCNLIASMMKTRLSDRTLPNITAIVAEGDNCGSGKSTLCMSLYFCIYMPIHGIFFCIWILMLIHVLAYTFIDRHMFTNVYSVIFILTSLHHNKTFVFIIITITIVILIYLLYTYRSTVIHYCSYLWHTYYPHII
jgi:hypothetical protein